MLRPAIFLCCISLFIVFFIPQNSSAQTSCPTLPTNTGSLTFNTTIPSTGSYKLWTRMRPSSTDVTANSFWLQFGNQCAVKAGDNTSAIPAGTWTWVDFKNGDTTQKTIFSLASGSQTFRIIGNEPGVQIDKVLLLTGGDTCIPTGVGDNCSIAATLTPTSAPVVTPTSLPTRTPTPTLTPTPIASRDTTKPTIVITNPLNGAVVTRRTTIIISANASDNVAVDRVTFSVGGNTSTDYSAPYTYPWSVPSNPNATSTITATAYDTSNNAATQSIRVTSRK